MESPLSLYKIFDVVAKTGNISQAAKELYISQPAISKAISKLEQNLNVILFYRNSRGVRLTEEGELLWKHTRQAFEMLEQGEDNLRRKKELGMGHIRIGVSTTLCKYLLLPYLKNFIEKNPHIQIKIYCQSTFQTLELLEKEKIDIGLIGKPENLKNLDFYFIRSIKDTFVAAKTYLANLKIREFHALNEIFKNANLMLLDEKNITRIYINEYFKTHCIETKQILEVSNMDLLIEFAKIGLGIACVIQEFVQDDIKNKTLVEIPLKVPIPKREVGFVYSTKYPCTNSMTKFIKYYKNTF